MQLDEVTKEALVEIQQELQEEGIEVSIQELADVVSSQLIAGNFAFKKGLEVRLPLFGTFIRKFGIDKGKAGKALEALKHTMSADAYKQKVLEAKLANKAATKQRRKDVQIIDFSMLKKLPNLVQIKNKYDKL